jgi:uncharacterized protein (TIGR03083 family)
MDIWPVIHDERKALAADLKGRTGEEWTTGSLCSQWTVRDVLAHMTSTASLTPPAFFGKLIGSGFSFDKVQEGGVAAHRGSSPADTMARFEAVVTSSKHPPGPADNWTRRRGIPFTLPSLALCKEGQFSLIVIWPNGAG